MSDASTYPRLSSQFRLQFEDAQQSWVLLYPEGMVKLNQSAGEILRRCDGRQPVAAIAGQLEQVFGATGLQREVQAFLDIARAQGWVEPMGSGSGEGEGEESS